MITYTHSGHGSHDHVWSAPFDGKSAWPWCEHNTLIEALSSGENPDKPLASLETHAQVGLWGATGAFGYFPFSLTLVMKANLINGN